MNYKKARKKLNMNQEQVAQKIGISLYAWQLIERGSTKKPHPENQKKIDRLFGTNKG
jgi:transcriptional regulator with XRE-family HTH domain